MKNLKITLIVLLSSILSAFASIPSPANIYGPTNSVCPGQTITYRCDTVNIQNASYLWTVPSTVTITSGQGTNIVNVLIGQSFTWMYLRVQSYNSYDTSAQRVIRVFSIPDTPLPISGPNIGACAGGTYVYFTNPVKGATSYVWTAPAGCTIHSPVAQGNPLVTIYTNVSIDFPAGFLVGNVSISANSGCGTSNARILNVRSVPLYPGAMTGTKYGVCNQMGVPYSIVPINGASSYTWSFVGSAYTTIHNNGSPNITVDYASSFHAATLKVVANNACGSSSPRNATIYATPYRTNSISGPIAACNNIALSSIGNYFVDSVYGATGYLWSIPVGANIVNGQGTDSITVDFIGSTSGVISATPYNSCGNGSTTTLSVTVNACRFSSENKNDNNNKIKVYPNPTNYSVFIIFDSKDKFNIKIYDMMGRVLKIENNTLLNNKEIILNNISPGLYQLEIENSNYKEIIPLVIY